MVVTSLIVAVTLPRRRSASEGVASKGHEGLNALDQLTKRQQVRVPAHQLLAPRATLLLPHSRAVVSECACVPRTP